jgi:hypothetical protein
MFQSHMAIVGIVIVLSLMVLFGVEQDKQDRQEWCEKHPSATRCKAAQHDISRTGFRAISPF